MRFNPFSMSFLVLFLISNANIFLAHAADASDRSLHNTVIDSTITLQGAQFYRAFTRALKLKTGRKNFDQVALKEFRSRRSGNKIRIEFHERILYITTVYPADRSIGKKAKRAAAIVSAKIGKVQLNALLSSQDDDLAGDELY